MDPGENNEISIPSEKERTPFKMPLLIGKVGKLPKKVVKENSIVKPEITSAIVKDDLPEDQGEISTERQVLPPNENLSEEKQLTLPYKEPSWSGTPDLLGKEYKLEVLKLGSIIETINLMNKSFWVFGRLVSCDISMAHPTISRFHAVLQYRGIESDNEPKGFYLYDLSSTHGTFLNKTRLKPRTYIKVHVGHLIRLGLSTRSYLLTGPETDAEEESEFTVTELKQRRREELERREVAEKEATMKRKAEEEAMQKKFEERGVDWGLGEDADEEADMTENPFAQTTNEELYLEDPKKALRGFMEREGHDLDYDCTEQGMGQFLCKVELPIDDERGRPIIAEVLHKGKKKEAVIQCALEACRILDRYGLLRQATHESRKRKSKNWEENDFYDSDEDTFLDRTGAIEKKREHRMKAKQSTKPETYQSLLEKEASLRKEINKIEGQLQNTNKNTPSTKSGADEDSLEYYMKELKQIKLDKQTISKLRSDLSKLKQDLATVLKLANIAKPADLPKLIEENEKSSSFGAKSKSKLPMFGKRLKVKVQMPERKETPAMNVDADEEEEEEDDEEQNETQKFKNHELVIGEGRTGTIVNKQTIITPVKLDKNTNDDKLVTQFAKIDNSFKMVFPLMSNRSEQNLRVIWTKMKSLHPEYSQCLREDLVKLFLNYVDNCPFLDSIDTFDKEIDTMRGMMKSIETSDAIIEAAHKVLSLAKEITLTGNRLGYVDESEESNEKMMIEDSPELEMEKKRKRNQRRIQQRQERAEIEKQKGYVEDAGKEDYNMWVPPADQTGDGRTNLNEKYGY